MHNRVCLHQVTMMTVSTAEFVKYCQGIGLHHMTLVTPMLFQPGETEAAIAAIGDGQTRCTFVNHAIAMGSSLDVAGAEETEKLARAIEVADRLGAEAIYLVSGGRGSLSWDAAAQKFAQIVAPCLQASRDTGVKLLVETASHLNCDMHLAHTLDDTVRLAEIAGIGVCIELQACWYEADLKNKFRRAMPLTGLVQVSDYVYGDRCTPGRAVPGDGAVPLQGLMGDLIELGYEGPFDLELIGPRITEEGPEKAARRAAENLSEILTRLGA